MQDVNKIGHNMFKDYCSYNNALQNIAEAGGLLVESQLMNNDTLMSFFQDSQIVRELILGNILYANTNPFILAWALACEHSANTLEQQDYEKLYYNYIQHHKNLEAYWYAKTITDVSIKTGASVHKLFEAIPFAELSQLFEFYHVFTNTDVIIEECYKPALDRLECNNE